MRPLGLATAPAHRSVRGRHVASSAGRHAAGPVPPADREQVLERGRAFLVALGTRPAMGKHVALGVVPRPRWWVE